MSIIAYRHGQIEAKLQPLPPLSETPGYRIVRGNPIASIQFDHGGAGGAVRAGIWACSEGAFECVEGGDELQTLLEGRLEITDGAGVIHEFSAGDSFITQKGERVTWNVIEPVVKVFFTYDKDGQ